jgi:hypothetical protein
MLRGIRNNWQKSKAAVLIETAFARSPVPFILPEGEARFANYLVEQLWSSDPGIFDGSEGPRPQPIAIAAAALAQGLLEYATSKVKHGTCLAALHAVITEVTLHRSAYSLSGPDFILIALAEDRLEEEAA